MGRTDLAGLWRWAFRLVAVAGLTLVVVTTTARLTLLDAGFDAKAIEATDGYDRVYAEVLPSPAVQRAIERGLSGLPVESAYLTANVRVLIPPPVLEQVVRLAIAGYVDVVLGKAERVDLDRVVQPVVDNLVRLVQELAPDAIATAPRLRAGSLAAFDTRVSRLFRELAAGEVDLRLPIVRLQARDVDRAAAVLTAGLPATTAVTLRPRIAALLASGDLSGAFALVVPAYLDEAAVQRIGVSAEAGARRALRSLPEAAAAGQPRTMLPLGLGWLTLLGLVLSTACLAPLLGPRGRRTRDIGATLAGAAGVALLTGLVLRETLVDPLRGVAESRGLDPSARRLALDIDRELRTGVARTYLALVAALAAIAVIVWLAPRMRLPFVRRHRLVAGLVAFAVTASLLVTVALTSTQAPRVCNGSTRLCDRPYNDVTYLTSHNAMASSDRGFLGANQDPDLTAQLDNGVRGLMLDLHYWTTPEEAAPYLASLDPQTAKVLSPLVTTLQPRPGVWLCHDVCQFGADPAISQLRTVGDWMRDHPDEVVTLILQDDVSASDVREVVAAAGLDPLLATPPAPGAPWPTLGQMIDSGHTLVVFTQDAAFSEGAIRNVYDYTAETPYAARTSADLSCDPGRGPASAPLFLVNNWISRGLPTRAGALSVNSRGFLLDRITRCQAIRGLHATFVAVDFAQVGDPLRVVDLLNARVAGTSREPGLGATQE